MAHVTTGKTSRCRHCDRPIIFYAMFHHKEQGRSASRNTWVHHQDQEISCPPGTVITRTSYFSRSEPRAEPNDLCTESLNTDRFDWHGRDCHRPIKDEDLMMCGIHARRVHEERAKEQAREAHDDRNQMIRDGVKQIVERLKAHGLESPKVQSYFDDRNFRYVVTGKIIVDPEELVELLDDLQELFD